MQQHLAMLQSGQPILKNVRLVFRPTISHPDLSQILDQNSGNFQPAIRLALDWDMGKPVDVLEVDGHTTSERVRELEKMLCAGMPYLDNFCNRESNPNLGKIAGTTGWGNAPELPSCPY
jgi:phosphoribulokinase